MKLTVAPLLALFALAPAFAQHGPPPGGPGGFGGPGGPGGHGRGPGPGPVEFALRAIDLTDAQKAQIDTLMKARHAAAEANRDAAMEAHRAPAEQVQATTFDEAAIRGKAAAAAVFEADRVVADAALLRDVRAVLTDAQRVKFNALLQPPTPPGPPPGK